MLTLRSSHMVISNGKRYDDCNLRVQTFLLTFDYLPRVGWFSKSGGMFLELYWDCVLIFGSREYFDLGELTMVFFNRIVNYCQHSSGLTSCQHLKSVFRVRVMPMNILTKFERQPIMGRHSHPYKNVQSSYPEPSVILSSITRCRYISFTLHHLWLQF